MVSLVVKTHVHNIVQELRDVSPNLGDLVIVATDGTVLTNKALLFGLFPDFLTYFCTNCAGGHDTVTIVIPDWEVDAVRKAFDKLFDGDSRTLRNILGWQKESSHLQGIYNLQGSKDDIKMEDTNVLVKLENEDSLCEDIYMDQSENQIIALSEQKSQCDIKTAKFLVMEEKLGEFPCLKCEKTFITRKKRTRHIREVHKITMTVSSSKLTSHYHECEKCKAVYTVSDIATIQGRAK